jgi:hypothetical protein
MSSERKSTSFVADVDTLKKLEELANFNQRSISGQIRWMVIRDYERVFGKEPEPKKAEVLPEEMPF